jgi:hypothetical protein
VDLAVNLLPLREQRLGCARHLRHLRMLGVERREQLFELALLSRHVGQQLLAQQGHKPAGRFSKLELARGGR